MKLYEAYDLMRRSTSDAPAAQLSRARKMVYDKIVESAQQLSVPRVDDHIKDDIAQEVFLNLTKRGTPLKRNRDDYVNALIRTAVRNEKTNYYRSQKKTRELNHKAQSMQGDLQHRGLDEPIIFDDEPESRILDGAEEDVDQVEQIYRFIVEVVFDDIFSRKPARSRACISLNEMREIGAEECTFDELVDAQVSDATSEKERERALAKIHKAHSRTRERISNWINKQKTGLDAEGISTAGLTEFDFQLLDRAVENLRSRAART